MEQSAKTAGKAPFSAYVKSSAKGTLISTVFTLAAVLLFALIIKETGLSDTAVSVVKQILKIGGIIVASYFAEKGFAGKHWLVGGIAGLIYVAFSYLVFSLIEGVFGNVALLCSNMLMGLLIGMVFAIIVVSLSGSKTSPARPKSRGSKKPFGMSRRGGVKKVANSSKAGI